jgi:hypothetical protein
MTALFIEGFETTIDRVDLAARNVHLSTIPSDNGQNSLTVPSRTGQAGRGLMLCGPYITTSVAYLPFCGNVDFGLIPTNQLVNNLWKSGGFSVGFNATFNKATQVQVAANSNEQIVYDGAQYYWAILEVGTTFEVGYSPDLINWTTTPAQPTSIFAGSTIAVIGSGSSATIVVSQNWPGGASPIYYSTNMGVTWTAGGTPANSIKGFASTGNSATPYLAVMTNNPFAVATLASISAVPTAVSGLSLGTGGSYNAGMVKVVAGYACAAGWENSATFSTLGAYSTAWYMCATSANMTTSSNWSATPTITSKQMNDITFFNNTWITVGYGGVYTAPNPGTTSNILPPTAAWTNVVNIGTDLIFSVAASSTMCVAVGQDSAIAGVPAIYTSPDGVNWTKTNRFSFAGTAASNSNCFMNVIWTGTQFVLTGGLNSNVIATSPDGIAWTATYYPDYTEVASGSTCGSSLGIYSGTLTAGSYAGGGQTGVGGFSPWSTSSSYMVGVGFYAGALASSARTVQAALYPGGTTTCTPSAVTGASQSVSTASSNSHFYEIIATAVSGTTNGFTYQFAIDGAIIGGSSTVYYLALSTDTGQAQLFVNLPRTGNWTVIDDIYLTNFTNDGSGNVGQLGIISVMPWVTEGDVSDQWTRSGSQSSDAACVAGPYSNSEAYVYASAVGAKDTYQMSPSIPAGYQVKAMQAEAYFSKNGSTGATATVGLISSSVELDSSAANATTATAAFASVLASVDPNTNTAWTNAGAAAAELTINKVT